MPLIPVTTKTIKAVEQSLNLRLRRHKMLVSNLANMNTPGYKAVDLVFEKALKQAMGMGDSLRVRATHPNHIGFGSSLDGPIEGEVVAGHTPSGRGDGNTVDIDYQMSRLLENQLLYTAGVQMMRRMFRGLSNTIDRAGAVR